MSVGAQSLGFSRRRRFLFQANLVAESALAIAIIVDVTRGPHKPTESIRIDPLILAEKCMATMHTGTTQVKPALTPSQTTTWPAPTLGRSHAPEHRPLPGVSAAST
jgi:hypothetical protein